MDGGNGNQDALPANVEHLPPEIHLAFFEHIDSATDLRSFLFASPKAAAVFLNNKEQVLKKLLSRILNSDAVATGLKIHHLRFHYNVDVATIGAISGQISDVLKFGMEKLQTLYWLCLRHEPFVHDALGQLWLRHDARPGDVTSTMLSDGEIIHWEVDSWWRTDIDGPSLGDIGWGAFVDSLPQRLRSGFFALKLHFRML